MSKCQIIFEIFVIARKAPRTLPNEPGQEGKHIPVCSNSIITAQFKQQESMASNIESGEALCHVYFWNTTYAGVMYGMHNAPETFKMWS